MTAPPVPTGAAGRPSVAGPAGQLALPPVRTPCIHAHLHRPVSAEQLVHCGEDGRWCLIAAKCAPCGRRAVRRESWSPAWQASPLQRDEGRARNEEREDEGRGGAEGRGSDSSYVPTLRALSPAHPRSALARALESTRRQGGALSFSTAICC